MIAPGGCALPAVEAGGMPSRNMRILLPVPAAGHPWPALGVPPASTAGPDLLGGRGRRAARIPTERLPTRTISSSPGDRLRSERRGVAGGGDGFLQGFGHADVAGH